MSVVSIRRKCAWLAAASAAKGCSTMSAVALADPARKARREREKWVMAAPQWQARGGASLAWRRLDRYSCPKSARSILLRNDDRQDLCAKRVNRDASSQSGGNEHWPGALAARIVAQVVRRSAPMKWQGREGSSNIEDRRGAGGGFGGGGLGGGFPGGGLSGGGIPIPIGGRGGFGGIVGIVVLLGICWALGINPLSLLTGTDGGSLNDGSGYTQSAPASADQQQLVDFVSVVV